MSQSYTYEITGWRDGRIAGEWYGDDEVLARDSCRELFARGCDVEVFAHGGFLGWVERGGDLPGLTPPGVGGVSLASGGLVSGRDWIDPGTGRSSCPACDGFGYHEDGSEEGELCVVCGGRGVARTEEAERWLQEPER
jgi:hypothetical protein